MKKSVTACLLISALVIVGMKGIYAQDYMISSPDSNILVRISTGDQLSYSIAYRNTSLVMPSPLGFEFKNEPAMQTGFTVIDKKEQRINESWQPVVRSKHATIVNHYNELQLSLVEKAGHARRMDIYFRLFNDGVAFRYRLYRSEVPGNRQITKELTGFRFSGNPKAWVAEYNPAYTSSQESEFWPRDLSYMSQRTVAGLPFLLAVNKDVYAAITEANINNYPGFYMGALAKTDSNITTLTTKLSPLPGEGEDGVKARFEDSLYTPWRVVMIGNTPGALIESEIIQNLNEPCAIPDPSWIKPGMSAWDHWWSGEVKMDNETIKEYIDLAAAQQWPYMLIDWQWYGTFNKPEADITKPAPQLNMPALLQYARSKNVRCWLWLYSSDVNRNNNFEKAFPLYESWGVAGIKIDFMDRDDQDMVNWYRQIIQKAAAHHLMVDFHGAFKPDGIIRTWPNMVTREGVLGEEYSKFSNRITPEHNVTLPFTRMLAGQMDYTPGGFINVTKASFKQTTPAQVMNTRCAELAKFVVYESPYTVYCDHPRNILGQPGADFLKNIPTVWDDIKVLGGYPAEYIVIAKQTGDRWYVGGMTNSTARTFTLNTSFLPDGNYMMEVWEDAKDAASYPQKLQTRKVPIKKGKTHTIKMAGGGGFTAIIKPI